MYVNAYAHTHFDLYNVLHSLVVCGAGLWCREASTQTMLFTFYKRYIKKYKINKFSARKLIHDLLNDDEPSFAEDTKNGKSC